MQHNIRNIANKIMKKNKNLLLISLAVLLSGIGITLISGLLLPVSSESCVLLVHRGDDAKKVTTAMGERCSAPQRWTFGLLTAATGYADHIHPGRYDIGEGQPLFKVFRNLYSGRQTPVRLTLPIVRTREELAKFLGEKLEMPTDSFYTFLSDSAVLRQYDIERPTALCIFLPNTYEVYWTITPRELLERMQRESRAFWTKERQAKLSRIMPGFTQNEAITLASIVEQETQNNQERPDVAGLYINRLRKGIPLQADPTVKFALQDFTIKRVTFNHLKTDSPYNTYKNIGLPPGPICTPSLASLNAVLNFREHNYIYMCAKEDFSGTHNFAADYATHLQNARRYAEALDRANIR